MHRRPLRVDFHLRRSLHLFRHHDFLELVGVRLLLLRLLVLRVHLLLLTRALRFGLCLRLCRLLLGLRLLSGVHHSGRLTRGLIRCDQRLIPVGREFREAV